MRHSQHSECACSLTTHAGADVHHDHTSATNNNDAQPLLIPFSAIQNRTLHHLHMAHQAKACSLKVIPGKGHAMLGQGTSGGEAAVARAGSAAEAEVRTCMEFWAATLCHTPAQVLDECVLIKPGVCDIQKM